MKDDSKNHQHSRTPSRQHVRFESDRLLYCYLNGQRFDAETMNVSRGGAFLVTDDPVPVGSLVVVVVQQSIPNRSLVQLVARVVRAQAGPRRGLGVEWIRAATGGSEPALLSFLKDFLQVDGGSDYPPAKQIADMVVIDLQSSLQVPAPAPPPSVARHAVPPAPVSLPAPPTVRSPPSTPTPPAPAPMDEVLPAPHSALTHSAALGPVTEFFLDTEAQAPTRLVAVLMAGVTSCQVQVVALGTSLVTLACDVTPADISRAVKVAVSIQTHAGSVEIRLSAYWTSLGAVGYPILRIAAVDDFASPGVYEKYLRRLRNKQMIASR